MLCLFLGGPVLSADGNPHPRAVALRSDSPRGQEINCQADPNGRQQKIQELQFCLRQVELRVRELNDCLRGDCVMQGGGRGQIPGGPGGQMPGGPGGPVPPGQP